MRSLPLWAGFYLLLVEFDGLEVRMAKERWASRAIVNILIDQKNFTGAAEVVSGCKDVFAARTKDIQESIAAIEGDPTAANGMTLQQALIEAADEIRQFREWQLDVKRLLLNSGYAADTTNPLMNEFEQAHAGANFLDALVTGALAKYFNAQV